MIDILDRARLPFRNPNELYKHAFDKGVLLKNFSKAKEFFYEAAKKFSEKGDQVMAARAFANALLYQYLGTADPIILPSLLKALAGLQSIEKIGLPTETMPVELLRLELECRVIEADIARTQNDTAQLRDLHKRASDMFQTIIQNPLITYKYIEAKDGHNERAIERHFYHEGMRQYYEAMAQAGSDPAAACDNLVWAKQAFQQCNDQRMLPMVAVLLGNMRIKRVCWFCGRVAQGQELHFWMSSANITPYMKRAVGGPNRDGSSADLENGQIAVCTPCLTMITTRAVEEADKVRKEYEKANKQLAAELQKANTLIQALNNRVSQLEARGN
jgi:hypothetical protein